MAGAGTAGGERTPGAVAIVTGASSGIGRATARAFARRGTAVVAVARREERLKALVEELRVSAPESFLIAGDLGERDFAERIVHETAQRLGRVDVLVNNAAVPMRKLLFDTSVEEAEAALRVNFLACLWASFAAIPLMLRQGSGTIVNVSSFASKVVPTHETLYAAAKCAMNGFSEGLWNDLRGSGIHVALVHPGPIDTEIWEKGEHPNRFRGRKHPPELVADAILEAVDRRLHELVVPRRNPSLVVARLLRLVMPRLLRAGMARLDAVSAEELEEARRRAREGRRLGERA
jgi:short-subunit dehydrogenase